MILLRVVVLYIRLSQEWPAAKVKPTGDQTILDWKFFISLNANFYCDCSNIFSLTLTYNGGLNTQ